MKEIERLEQVKFRGKPAKIVFDTQDFLDEMNAVVLSIFTLLSEDKFKTLNEHERSLLINQFLVGYLEAACEENKPPARSEGKK